MLKKTGLKLPESLSFYVLIFFLLSWAIVHYTYLGYYESIRWFIWSFVVVSYVLFFLWFSYSYVISKIFKIKFKEFLKKDLLTYLPLFLLFFKSHILFTISILSVIIIKMFLFPGKIKFGSEIPKKEYFEKPLYVFIFILIAVIVSIVFLMALFNNFSYSGLHDWDYHEFSNEVARKSILEYKQFPLWNPYYCGGNVMLANPQSAFLSPFYLFVLLFGAVKGLKISALFHLIVGLCGMYVLARYLNITRSGSYLTAFIFMLSGFFISHLGVGHTTFLPIAFLPWVFYYYLKSLKRTRYVFLSSLFLILMFFEGGVYPFMYTFLFITIYSLSELYINKNFTHIKKVLIIFFLVVLIGSIKFLPLLEFTLHSPPSKYNLEEGYTTEILINSIINGKLNKLVFYPEFFKGQTNFWHEYYSYIGLVALVLSIMGLIISLKRRSSLVFICIIFFVLSYGRNSYLDILGILKLFPIFEFLDVPSRFIIIVLFCLSLFAGFFISYLKRKKIPHFLIILLVIYITLNLIFINSQTIKDKFTIENEVPEPSKVFYQKINENIVKDTKNRSQQNFSIISQMYPYLLMNIGTINCYDKVRLPIAAEGIQNETYKGESYYVISNMSPKIIFFSPNKISLSVNVSKTDLLVINQNHHSGWKVKNGKVVSYKGLTATKVNPSDKIIEMYYLPSSFLVGLILTVISLTFSILFYFNNKFRKKAIIFLKILRNKLLKN